MERRGQKKGRGAKQSCRPAENLLSTISSIRAMAHKRLSRELEQRGILGISPSHGDIVVTLYSRGPLPMKDISALINRDKSTVTVLVAKLRRHGYVRSEPDPDDARVRLIRLTEHGRRLIPSFKCISKKIFKDIYQGISQEEKLQTTRVLERILQNLAG